MAVGMESQGRCWRPFRDRIKSHSIRWVDSSWQDLNGGGAGEEARGNSRVHTMPGILSKASKDFRGGKEISSWRPCYHNDIKLIHEQLGISLAWGRGVGWAVGKLQPGTKCGLLSIAGPQAENGYYVFKWVFKKSTEECESCKIQISMYVKFY